MAGNQGRRNLERFSLVVGDNWIGNIETRYTSKQVLMLWDFWQDELQPGHDEQFHKWLLVSGYAEDCLEGTKLELPSITHP